MEAVAERTRASKTDVVHHALKAELERLDRPAARGRGSRARLFLERDVWPDLHDLGPAPDKQEREAILGYGESGV